MIHNTLIKFRGWSVNIVTNHHKWKIVRERVANSRCTDHADKTRIRSRENFIEILDVKNPNSHAEFESVLLFVLQERHVTITFPINNF